MELVVSWSQAYHGVTEYASDLPDKTPTLSVFHLLETDYDSRIIPTYYLLYIQMALRPREIIVNEFNREIYNGTYQLLRTGPLAPQR